MTSRWELLLVDANVLIDYAASDPKILQQAARHLGSVYVLRSVLSEVQDLDLDDCARLGLEVITPSLEQISQAADQATASLSFEDRLCLLVASEAGWTCVTNDKVLRKACARQNVPVRWGLELMLALVQRKQLDSAKALAVASAIHENNPHHITADILHRFQQALGADLRE